MYVTSKLAIYGVTMISSRKQFCKLAKINSLETTAGDMTCKIKIFRLRKSKPHFFIFIMQPV